MAARRFQVYRVGLDPAQGREMRKTRPCVVLSPNVMNRSLGTVIVAPLTSTQHPGWPTRISCHFGGRTGEIALDQLRAVDHSRLKRLVGSIDAKVGQATIAALQALFAP